MVVLQNIVLKNLTLISFLELGKSRLLLRLLTHVGFLRQNGLILSEVFLYAERSKNHEKKYIITVQKEKKSPS